MPKQMFKIKYDDGRLVDEEHEYEIVLMPPAHLGREQKRVEFKKPIPPEDFRVEGVMGNAYWRFIKIH